MFGSHRPDRSGQLATLDAIVFFAAAMVISGVLLSYARSGTVERPDAVPYPDPENLLEVFLRASIGQTVTLDIGGSVVVRGNDPIGECLLMESRALTEGLPVEPFRPMNDIFLETLEESCGPGFQPRISVLTCEGAEILSIGARSPPLVREAFAGSSELYDEDGMCYLVVLVLTSRAA